MRRRRLIGMYRVLLKSMNLVCSGRLGIATHDGAAVSQEGETEREPGPGPTYPIGLPSTIDPVLVTISFTVLPPASRLLFLTICSSYLGLQQVCRNEAAGTNSAHKRNLMP